MNTSPSDLSFPTGSYGTPWLTQWFFRLLLLCDGQLIIRSVFSAPRFFYVFVPFFLINFSFRSPADTECADLPPSCFEDTIHMRGRSLFPASMEFFSPHPPQRPNRFITFTCSSDTSPFLLSFSTYTWRLVSRLAFLSKQKVSSLDISFLSSHLPPR